MRLTISLLVAGVVNAVSHYSTNISTTSSLSTCSELQSSLGSDIVQLSGTEYLASASSAWNLFNAESLPACIIFPRNASHVQSAMAAIYRDKVHYAVQAGGHSAMAGWNTVQDGIMFFFSHMKNVSYNAKSDTITIQPGIHWGEALTALEPLGVAALGGRLGDVGTGLLLGGGLNYLSGEYGYSSDSYVELDVVLVTGQLVTANANNQYADLFRALKGGANRFGIVTRYEVDAIHTGTTADKNWFGGLIMYPNSSAEALLNATEKYARTVTDPKASILMVFTNTVNGTTVVPSSLLTLLYHGPSLPQSIFGDFLSIPSTFKQLSSVSWIEANNFLGAGADRGFGQLFGASVFSGTGGIDPYIAAFRQFTSYTNDIKSSLFGDTLAFTPILQSQVQAGKSKGSNIMDPPLQNYVAVQVQTQTLNGMKVLPNSVVSTRQTFFSQLPRATGLPLYINECDSSQNVFATYGRYEELKATYAKYDPTRFNVLYTDGPIGL